MNSLADVLPQGITHPNILINIRNVVNDKILTRNALKYASSEIAQQIVQKQQNATFKHLACRFFYDEIRKNSQHMPPIYPDAHSVVGYFDRILLRFVNLPNAFITAKDFAEMFSPIDGIDVDLKFPDSN